MKFELIIIGLSLIAILVSTNHLSVNPLHVQQAYASNPNLLVSAENSLWNNYFAGPQVIQVIVIDSDINQLNQTYGEPLVTINGKKLRMAQATDGNWYGYFADSKQAQIADSTSPSARKGLNFGQFCSPTSALTATGVDFSETKGIAISSTAAGASEGTHTPSVNVNATCATAASIVKNEHVVRENKTLNNNAPSGELGQISTNNAALSDAWPVIQLYDFSSGIPTTVVVDYHKLGGDQIVNLTFDRIPTVLINSTVDRSSYSENSDVFVTMNDPQLNIDPTEEDSWTWGSNAANNTLFYQLFDRNGIADADGTLGAQNLLGNLTVFMFNHNGKLIINPATLGTRVIDFQTTGKQQLAFPPNSARGDPNIASTSSINAGSMPITFIESGGVNTGVFVNWDTEKKSNIITIDNQTIRGKAATILYNDMPTSIVGGFSFGSIFMNTTNSTWIGQRIPVTLVDVDSNKNSKIAEHLEIYDPKVKRITTMKIGKPFSLASGNLLPLETAVLAGKATFTPISSGLSTVTFSGQTAKSSNISEDEQFSFRPVFNFTNSTGGENGQITSNSSLFIDLVAHSHSLFDTIHDTHVGNSENFSGFNFINFDLRSFSPLGGASGGVISKIHMYLVYNATGSTLSSFGGIPNNNLTAVSIANSTSLQGFINLNVTQTEKVENPQTVNSNTFAIPSTAPIGILITFTTTGGTVNLSNAGQPIVVDFFSIGLIGNGTTHDQRINNGIYRFELEESGDNTSVFTGTNQYVMLNQVNIFDPATYSTLRTINHDVKFAAMESMLQSEARAPQVTFLDLGHDGLNTPISTQQDVQTHSGIVKLDNSNYVTGNTATVTVDDPDLNVDNDLIVIYTTVPTGNDPASDTIGKAGLGLSANGNAFGQLLEIKFNGVRWTNTGCFGNATHTIGGYDMSLSSTGFSLVETAPGSNIFTGNFEIPDSFCINSQIIGSSSSAVLSADYDDFRDYNGTTVVESTFATIGTQPLYDQYHIDLKATNFTPIPGLNIAEIKDGHNNADIVHFLLQFKNIPTESERTNLATLGIGLTSYVTGHTYIASSQISNLNNLLLDTNAKWAGPLSYDLKKSPILKASKIGNIPKGAVTNSTHIVVTISPQEGENFTKFLDDVSHIGVISSYSALVPSAVVSVNFKQIDEIAKMDSVQFVDIVEPPLTVSNDNVRKTADVDILHHNPSPPPSYDLDGTGVTVLVYDLGFITNMPGSDFEGRISWSSADPTVVTSHLYPHATHVGGIIGGDGRNSHAHGGWDKQWAGMAPKSNLVSFFNTESLTLTTFPDIVFYNDPSNMLQDFTQSLSHTPKPDLASMSLNADILTAGCFTCFGDYQETAQLIDKIVTGVAFDPVNPLIFFEAVGNERNHVVSPSVTPCPIPSPLNSRYCTIVPPATAKDSIGVGSIKTTSYEMTGYSGWGPTLDHRLKPDIVAPGGNSANPIHSVHGTNYADDWGTSQATAVAAGVSALLIQQWEHPPAPQPTMPAPAPSTIKAIMIHTATDLLPVGPDYKSGWGALDARSAIDLIKDDQGRSATKKLIHVGCVIPFGIPSIPGCDTSQSFLFNSSGADEVKATLIWDDPPSASISGGLTNDLTLELKDPIGHVYTPLVLDPNNPTDPARQGIDTVNNVEMAIGSTRSGDWTATVFGNGITTSTPQGFTLIVSEVFKRTTTTTLTNNIHGSAGTIVATISDTGSGLALQPIGDVNFDDGGNGGTFTGKTCTASGNDLKCTVNYSRSSWGSVPITTQYLGDQAHKASVGSQTVDTTDYVLLIIIIVIIIAIIIVILIVLHYLGII